MIVDTVAQIRRGKILLVLVLYFAINWLILYALYNFSSPAFHGAVTWWVALIDSLTGSADAEAFDHFPNHLYFLAGKFGWAKILTGLLFESLALGLVAAMFNSRFVTGGLDRSYNRSFLRLWPHLVLAWLLVNLLTIAVGEFLPRLLAPLTETPRRLLALQVVLLPAGFTLVFGAFMFTIPCLAVYRENIGRAIVRSLRIFIHNPVTCLVLAALVLALPVALSTISSNPVRIVESFRPELVYWLLLLGLIVEMPANFLWMGATVRFLADQAD
ncbi:MAG: hypothetical protein JSU65_08925 [Candidatus Zixiibacteriota bacterium]|nr:MAG: hypothetical protein JSU65_08925 [candidate division Zixibacteria bacterium]